MARTSALSPATSRRRGGCAGRSSVMSQPGPESALDNAAPTSFECSEAPKLPDLILIALAIEGRGHASEIADRGNLRTDALSKWLSIRAAPKVVIAAGALGHEYDVDVAGGSEERGDGFVPRDVEIVGSAVR